MNLSFVGRESQILKKDKIFQQKKETLNIRESWRKKLQMCGVVNCLSLENLEFERLHSKSFERLVGNSQNLVS